MKQSLILILDFFKNPSHIADCNQSFLHKLKWLALVFILEIILIFLLIPLQKIPEVLDIVNINDHKVVQLLDTFKSNLFLLSFYMILFAPIIEELIFRLPLRPKINYFIPSILLGILITGISIAYKYKKNILFIILITLLLAGVAFYILFNKKINRRILKNILSNYKFYFYSVALLFAAVHIFNYRLSWQVIVFIPLLVLPQFVLGVFLGFIRIKFGFLWGFFLHALHNTIVVLFILTVHNSTNKFIAKIDTDSYTIEIHEGYAFGKENGIILNDKYSSTRKITPNEIILFGSFKNVVSDLTNKKRNRVEFKNNILAEKTISLYFHTDSAHQYKK